jgi:lysophospholipase L1-like esterase
MKNTGDPSGIMEVMKRASKGGLITIGFIGGSITQGAIVSDEALCYAARVFKWWKDSFPNAAVRYVNAGIGATTSQFGVARVPYDLLKYDPDFVIVEYSVNDNDEVLDGFIDNNTNKDRSALFRETYEGLIRKIMSYRTRSGHTPAILIVHSVKYDNGRNAEEIHSEIGRHYGIPCISMKELIYDRLNPGVKADTKADAIPGTEAGAITNANVNGDAGRDRLANVKTEDITQDMLHPNDTGHGIVAGFITDYLSGLKLENENREREEAGKRRKREPDKAADDPEITGLPPALTDNKYENVTRYNRLNINPVLNGFTADDTPVMKPFEINTCYGTEEIMETNDDPVLSSEVRDVFKNGWTASKKGDSISFEFAGTELLLMYRKSVKKPAPVAYAVIDGDEAGRIRLDANFDEDWGDKAFMATLMYHGRICKDGMFPEDADGRDGYSATADRKNVSSKAEQDDSKTYVPDNENAVKERFTKEWNGETESNERFIKERNDVNKKHTLTVTVEEADNCMSDFYLLNVIGKLQ